jgi:hypothetical protein
MASIGVAKRVLQRICSHHPDALLKEDADFDPTKITRKYLQ